MSQNDVTPLPAEVNDALLDMAEILSQYEPERLSILEAIEWEDEGELQRLLEEHPDHAELLEDAFLRHALVKTFQKNNLNLEKVWSGFGFDKNTLMESLYPYPKCEHQLILGCSFEQVMGHEKSSRFHPNFEKYPYKMLVGLSHPDPIEQQKWLHHTVETFETLDSWYTNTALAFSRACANVMAIQTHVLLDEWSRDMYRTSLMLMKALMERAHVWMDQRSYSSCHRWSFFEERMNRSDVLFGKADKKEAWQASGMLAHLQDWSNPELFEDMPVMSIESWNVLLDEGLPFNEITRRHMRRTWGCLIEEDRLSLKEIDLSQWFEYLEQAGEKEHSMWQVFRSGDGWIGLEELCLWRRKPEVYGVRLRLDDLSQSHTSEQKHGLKKSRL